MPEQEQQDFITMADLKNGNSKGMILMAKEKSNGSAKMADKLTENWLTKEEFADELDTNVNNLNQILANGPEAKKFPKPGPQYCQRVGKGNKYSPAYVKLVKDTRKDVKARGNKAASQVKRIKSPDLTSFSIPVYKNHIATLVSLGISEEQIRTKLASAVSEMYNKVQSKVNEIKASIEL